MYFKSDVLLLADVLENFRKMCLEIYKLDPVRFISAPGLAWHVPLKKTKVELDILTDINILLMIEKGSRGRICNEFITMKKLIICTWRNIIKTKNRHTFNTGMYIMRRNGQYPKSFQHTILNG